MLSMVSSKRFKRAATLIEDLPNEIFFDIFSYLSDVDTVCAFSRLNTRFQCLTVDSCHTFDFKLVSKAKFDYVIRQHDAYQWQALRLSDDDKTPGQVTYFGQLLPFNGYISQLTVLSIIDIKPNTLLTFLPHLQSLTHLVSLSLGSVCGNSIPNLQLLSLKHVVINSCMHTQWMNNLYLETLQHTIEHNCTHANCLIWPKTLKKLTVSYSKSSDNEIVRTSLKPLSQLTNLTIYDNAWESSPPDGQIWENLIKSSIPLLQKFNFCFKFWRDFNLTSDIIQIVSTFSTPFYLQEKSWFIKCDYYHQQLSTALLYSLPYSFEHFDIVTRSFDESVTTLNNNNKKNNLNKHVYKTVKTLTVDVACKKISQELLLENILNLNLKYSGQTMDWLYSMTQLKQISFRNQIDMSHHDFSRLLKTTPNLNTLTISNYLLRCLTNQWQDKLVCKFLSHKIRSLQILSNDYVKVDEIVHIVRIFHQCCRHLNISVYSRNIVAGYILRNMQHLRSFIVKLKEHGKDLEITKKWLIQQNIAFKHLDCSIVVNENEYSFWFGRRR